MLLYFGSLTILHAPEGFVCDLAHTCSGARMFGWAAGVLQPPGVCNIWHRMATLAVSDSTGRASEKAGK